MKTTFIDKIKNALTFNKKKEPVTISERINIKLLYRVKGHTGLHYPLAKGTDKAGNISMRNWLNGKTTRPHRSMLIALGQTFIYRNEEPPIHLSEAFDNIYKLSGGQTVNKDFIQLEQVCPNYDPDQFKKYHMEQLISWYNEILTKTDQLAA